MSQETISLLLEISTHKRQCIFSFTEQYFLCFFFAVFDYIDEQETTVHKKNYARDDSNLNFNPNFKLRFTD